MLPNNQKNSNKTIKIIILTSIIIFLSLIIFIFLIVFLDNDNTSEIQENGERYGKSEFYKYKDKIYILIAGAGMLEVDEADISTFKAFDRDNNYNSGNVGFDKNRVYFGNIPILDLDPNKLYYVGNNYYSDGDNSYFCSISSKYNEELSSGSEIIQNISHFLFKTKKPQNYIYAYKKLETNKKLKVIEDLPNFVTDGEEIYYKGENLPNADINSFKRVDRELNLVYFADKDNVYYKSKILPIKNNDKLKVFQENNLTIFYLYDDESGNVFANDYPFDTVHSPYKVIGNGGEHNYNLFFISKDGVYFYNPKKEKQERIGDNIFKGEVKEISPNIFSDDENIYYLDAFEIRAKATPHNGFWLRKDLGNNELISLNSGIYYLDKKDDWEKVEDIRNGNAGTIWKKGNRYYYFDNEGIQQLIPHSVYEISDKETLDYILTCSKSNTINFEEEIRKLINDKKLIAVKGEEKMMAVIEYIENPYGFDKTKIIFILIIVIIAAFAKYKLKK